MSRHAGLPHTSSRLAPLHQRVPAVRAVCLDAPRTEVRYGEPQLRQDARTNDHQLFAEGWAASAKSGTVNQHVFAGRDADRLGSRPDD